jgi:hypothetical protein
VSALDAKIDHLYRLPLNEFTGARDALAKSLSGGDAARLRALAKPTVVPWAVNQVYWRARRTYDRLMKNGEKLRAAQIAALEGRAADVRAASDAHRRAIGEAVAEAARLAAPAGAKPSADALGRTFEALSLATNAPESPGRLTDALQPAGFEALAGIPNLKLRTENSELRTSKTARRTPNVEPRTQNVERRKPREERPSKVAARAAEEAARAAAEQKKHEAAVKDAEAKVARAEAAERKAREVWERAHDALLDARRRLAELKSEVRILQSQMKST